MLGAGSMIWTTENRSTNMHIYIMRHGEAQILSVKDEERPLTKFGK